MGLLEDIYEELELRKTARVTWDPFKNTAFHRLRTTLLCICETSMRRVQHLSSYQMAYGHYFLQNFYVHTKSFISFPDDNCTI